MPSSLKGRAASQVRTPLLVREYLMGSVAFPGDQEGDGATRASDGDFIARMHQRVKLQIREISPEYQYPRKHSFLSFINALITLGLVERTGQREDPEERGAGIVGVARGFEQRTWVRLTEGSAGRIEWADPMGHLALIYPGMRRPGAPLPEGVPQPVAPRPRPRRRARGAPAGPTPEVVRSLEAWRRDMIADLAVLQDSTRPEDFDAVANAAGDYLANVREAFPTTSFTQAFDMLGLLTNCNALLREAATPAQRARAVLNCQSSARLLREALVTPLRGAVLRPEEAEETLGVRELPKVPTITLPKNFTTRSVPRLTAHLEELVDLAREYDWPDEEFPELTAEVIRLIGTQLPSEPGEPEQFSGARGWLDAAQDSLQNEIDSKSPNAARLEALRQRVETLASFISALEEDQDLDAALDELSNIESLEES